VIHVSYFSWYTVAFNPTGKNQVGCELGTSEVNPRDHGDQSRNPETTDPTIASRRYHNEVVPRLAENTPEILHPCLAGTA
jgi:hypothetical protein